MTWNGSKLLKHTIQFLAIIAALFTAMTRVSDYKHHWSDVLSGLVIGTITACVVVRLFFILGNYTLLSCFCRKLNAIGASLPALSLRIAFFNQTKRTLAFSFPHLLSTFNWRFTCVEYSSSSVFSRDFC